MTFSNDDAYDHGDPKRSDYRETPPCDFCGGRRGHYVDCPIHGTEPS